MKETTCQEVQLGMWQKQDRKLSILIACQVLFIREFGASGRSFERVAVVYGRKSVFGGSWVA